MQAMHERALRTVLLIRSIDEGDTSGEVLSLAERTEATKAAAQGVGTIPGGRAGGTLPPAAEKLVVRRAELLLHKLEARSPVITGVLDLAGGASALGWVVLAIAFVVGGSMSALDGRQRIDVLSFPLLGLITWNFIVYVVSIAALLKRKSKQTARPSALSGFYATWIRNRADALLKRSSRVHVPLSEAMQRFAHEWSVIARPLMLLRAQRLFHLGAACVALGLIAGLYVRGLVLRYDAGWESTFLDAEQTRALLGVIYGPASALSGIVLPTLDEVHAMRWRETGTGVSAGPWIHLIAITAGLYIVLPRVILALVATARLFRAQKHPQLPAAFDGYARAILRDAGCVPAMTASAISYAYAPPRDALSGLSTLLTDALGTEVKVAVTESVAYGEEDAFAERVKKQPLPDSDCQVLVMSAAATPESENHGTMIEALRRALAKKRTGFLLVIDESAYVARMDGDESLAQRRGERERTWREFAAARNQAACIVELSRLRAGDRLDADARDHVREALQRANA
jgi:hypothetical protein